MGRQDSAWSGRGQWTQQGLWGTKGSGSFSHVAEGQPRGAVPVGRGLRTQGQVRSCWATGGQQSRGGLGHGTTTCVGAPHCHRHLRTTVGGERDQGPVVAWC